MHHVPVTINRRRDIQLRNMVLAASTICWQCGHPQANSADHVIPRAQGGPTTLANLKPIHHGRCPTCNKDCNRTKNDKPPTNPSSRGW